MPRTDEQIAETTRDPYARPSPPLTHERVAELLTSPFTEYQVPGVGYLQKLTRGELMELCATWKSYHNAASPSPGPSEMWLVVRRVVTTLDYDHDGNVLDTRRVEFAAGADGVLRLVEGTVTDPDGRVVERYGPAPREDEVVES